MLEVNRVHCGCVPGEDHHGFICVSSQIIDEDCGFACDTLGSHCNCVAITVERNALEGISCADNFDSLSLLDVIEVNGTVLADRD